LFFDVRVRLSDSETIARLEVIVGRLHGASWQLSHIFAVVDLRYGSQKESQEKTAGKALKESFRPKTSFKKEAGQKKTNGGSAKNQKTRTTT
jgi:hypothetical protein